MSEEPAVTKSFKLPSSYAPALSQAAKDRGQSVSEFVRDLVIRELTDESKEELDQRNADELRAIRMLSNLLRSDVANVAKLMLRYVVKWDEEKTTAWLQRNFDRDASG